MRNVKTDGARCRTLANDNVEEEVLHCGVEDLLDLVVEAVYLVHKEDVALLEVGEYGGKVSRASDSRPDVVRSRAPISLATTLASVVFPRPGGPEKST